MMVGVMSPSTLQAVLTAPEAAKRYGLSRRYLVKLVSSGAVRGRKAGGTWLIDATSVRQFFAVPRHQGRPKRRK